MTRALSRGLMTSDGPGSRTPKTLIGGNTGMSCGQEEKNSQNTQPISRLRLVLNLAYGETLDQIILNVQLPPETTVENSA